VQPYKLSLGCLSDDPVCPGYKGQSQHQQTDALSGVGMSLAREFGAYNLS